MKNVFFKHQNNIIHHQMHNIFTGKHDRMITNQKVPEFKMKPTQFSTSSVLIAPIQIQIESGMSCYSLSDDVSGQEQDEDEDTGESSFLLFGEETSFE